MINIGGNPLMILLAIVAALGGVGLYFVRNFKPELSRDHDVFFSAIALVYGVILLGFNFRMEITTQLAQVLVVGFAGWFAVESLILRQALSEQARRSPTNPFESEPDDEPVRPRDNNPSYGYRVELDPRREISDRAESSRRMRSVAADASELGGDVRGRSRREERGSRRRSSTDGFNSAFDDEIIDVGTEEAQDRGRGEVRDNSARSGGSDRRRGKPINDLGSSFDYDESDRSFSSESTREEDQDNSRRPRRPRTRNSSSEVDDFGDF
jgi:hypothetical protein